MRAPLRVLFLALALAAACRDDSSATPAAETGEPRIVSLSPSTTEILVALGARQQIVGADRFSLDVEGCAPPCSEIPSLGGLFAPDLERLVELHPTLVIGVKSESQAAFFAALRSRGIEAREVDTGGSLDDVIANYAVVGALIGDRPAGEALARRVRGQLARVSESRAQLPRASTALVVEREPLYVVGGGSFASALIDIAGGRNVFADLTHAYPQVSLELLAERAPDVLIDSTQVSNGAGAEAAARAYWKRFGWVKRVELVPPGTATLPGIRLATAAELLAVRIHPEKSE